jgi:hypothetical protein
MMVHCSKYRMEQRKAENSSPSNSLNEELIGRCPTKSPKEESIGQCRSKLPKEELIDKCRSKSPNEESIGQCRPNSPNEESIDKCRSKSPTGELIYKSIDIFLRNGKFDALVESIREMNPETKEELEEMVYFIYDRAVEGESFFGYRSS